MLAGGFHGIQHELELPAPHKGDAYTDPLAEPLPRSLGEAAGLLEQSTVARSLLGDDFVDHYAESRKAEAREFAAAVTDWELKRYLLKA